MKLILLVLAPMLAMSAGYEFSNESALSMVKVGGNSKLSTTNLKTVTTGKKDKSALAIGGHYTMGKAEDTSGVESENARNWDAFVKYTYQFTKVLGAYANVQFEGDKFAGFDERENYGLGAKYIFSDTDKLKSFFELGFRYTVNTDLVNKETYAKKMRAYYTISKQQTKTVSWKFWTEYLPNLDDSEAYIITYEPSLRVVMNSTFSLEVAYKGVYQNVPAAGVAERTDYIQTTSLIAKF